MKLSPLDRFHKYTGVTFPRSVLVSALALLMTACDSSGASSTAEAASVAVSTAIAPETDGSASASSATTAASVTPATGSTGAATGTDTGGVVASNTAAATIVQVPAATSPAPATAASKQVVISATTAAKVESIRNFGAKCDGQSDDRNAIAAGILAARHAAFTLQIDCQMFMHVGMDPTKSVFFDNDTTVSFTSAGQIRTDNVFVPAFVIANSYRVSLLNWRLEYDASVPVNWDTGGFYNSGRWVTNSGYAQPAFASSNTVSNWLTANRTIKFDNSKGHAAEIWMGATNSCAVFQIIGDSSSVSVTGMKAFAPSTAGAERFIPMLFSITRGWLNNTTVNAQTPINAQTSALPHYMVFENIDIDGVLMGWQGSMQDVHFENITSHRYADLQDASGHNVGGVGKWFAPPHLFYLNYDVAGDTTQFNSDIQIDSVNDLGVRLGVARDVPPLAAVSGSASSLKIGCTDCSINNFKSARPDGALDILASKNLAVSNVTASYSSDFVHDLYHGIRFPITPGTVGASYNNLSLTNVQLTDTAASSAINPLDSISASQGNGISFSNVNVWMKAWAGANTPTPIILGANLSLAVKIGISSNSTLLADTVKNSLSMTLQAKPSTLKVNQNTSLMWGNKEAYTCAASGAWGGSLGSNGTKVVKMTKIGAYDYSVTCKNNTQSVTGTVRVTVTN